MLYLVHGKNQKSNRVLRVHAETAAEAEAIGFKRGFFVSEVTEVASNDPRLTLLDRAGEMLWRCWRHTPRNAFKCFGRPISSAQAVTLALLGIMTWVVDFNVLILTHLHA